MSTAPGTNAGNTAVGGTPVYGAGGGGTGQGTQGGTTLPGGPSSTPGSSTGDPLLDSLTGSARDAAVALNNLFSSYGLGTLAPKIVEYLKDGFSADTISLLLQQTKEFKDRFPANEARLKGGLPVLSPAEYISTENAYRQVLSSAGLPIGFYDDPVKDFSNWIAGDVSPTEIQGRVQVASDLINNADPNTLAQFKKFYTQGELVAYALDRNTAEPLLERQFKAAQIAGAAANNGVDLGQSQAEQLAGAGVSHSQATQGFGYIGQTKDVLGTLNSIYGGNVSTEDLVNSVFNNDAQSTLKVNKLASQERGTFGGTTGTGASSLNKSDAGQF